jgi:ADP-ribosylglycohydrolase
VIKIAAQTIKVRATHSSKTATSGAAAVAVMMELESTREPAPYAKT